MVRKGVPVSADGTVSSLERALRIMEALAEGPLGVTALANRLDLNKTTVFRLTRTLQEHGYAVQLEDTSYRLGPRCMMLAAAASGEVDYRRDLRWALEEIAEKTRETALLSILVGRDAVCIDSIPSRQSVVSVATVGEIWPAHTCSAGLAFLADDDVILDRYLSEPLTRSTSETIATQKRLRETLKTVRERGYSVNTNYFRDGVCAVGALVHDSRGHAVAALSVMMPDFRFTEVGEEALASVVVDVATRASKRLGWRP